LLLADIEETSDVPKATSTSTLKDVEKKEAEKLSSHGSATASTDDTSDGSEDSCEGKSARLLLSEFKADEFTQRLGKAIPSIRQSYRYYWLIILIPIFYLMMLAGLYFLDAGEALAHGWIALCNSANLLLKVCLVLTGAAAPVQRLISLAFAAWNFRRVRDESREPRQLKHIVVVPAYREPLPVLIRTLQSLPRTTDPENPESPVHVVMAFEAKDDTHAETFDTLKTHFGRDFASLTMTVHSHVPSERPGKGSNENYALRQIMGDALQMREDPWRTMVTICDADSVFAPGFFDALESSYRGQLDGRRLIYSAPRNTYRNFGRLYNPLICMGECSMNDSDLTENILMPYSNFSNYSMLLGFVGEIDFWDPEVIPEDFHMVYKAMLCSRGANNVARVWSIISNDTVTSFGDRYVQAKRHMWGVTNIAWILAIFRHAPFSLDRLWFKLLEAYAAEISDNLTPRVLLYLVLGYSVFLHQPASSENFAHAAMVLGAAVAIRTVLSWLVFIVTETYIWRYQMSTLGDAVDRPGWCQLIWLYGCFPLMTPLSRFVFGTLACWDAAATAFWSSEFEYVTAPKE
jgi:hypothetical protein